MLFINRDSVTLTPWITSYPITYPTYASGNNGYTAIIVNSEKSVIVLDEDNTLISKIDAKKRSDKHFSTAKFVDMDEENNL
jgi:hypothetical protein